MVSPTITQAGKQASRGFGALRPSLAGAVDKDCLMRVGPGRTMSGGDDEAAARDCLAGPAETVRGILESRPVPSRPEDRRIFLTAPLNIVQSRVS